MPNNSRMLRVATGLCGRGWSRYEAGTGDVGLATAADDDALAAADLRDRASERASLRPLLAPATVAVVARVVSPVASAMRFLRALVEYSFTGRIYAVNPQAHAVAGVASYPTLTARHGIPIVRTVAGVGIVHDQLFGSLVMAGLGGVYTDMFADRVFRLVPMTHRDAGRMWRSLRAAPLLTGYRRTAGELRPRWRTCCCGWVAWPRAAGGG